MSRAATLAAQLLRVALAAAICWLCFQDLPALLLRGTFEDLPAFEYRAEAERLLEAHRHSEALLVVEAGAAAAPGDRAAFDALRTRIEQDEARFWAQLRRVGQGALTGRGDTVEALGGAIVADLFVFGDVRDLVLQTGNAVRGDPVDPVIVGLSAAGLALTATPAVDLGAALLKFARRVGAMSDRLAAAVLRALRRAGGGEPDEIGAIANSMTLLARRARPAPALRILKHVDDPAELRAVTRFAERPDGALALWLGERQAVQWVSAGARGEALALKAARRGRAGFAYIADHGADMFRLHPLLGLVKGFYKGNIPELLVELARRHSAAAVGLSAGWLLYELLRLAAWAVAGRRVTPRPGFSSAG